MSLVILDRQHGSKTPGKFDPGAASDLDGDGLVEVHEQEANLTPLYIAEAARRLTARGHEVVTLDSGPYTERHSTARRLARANGGRTAYIACHLNAGGGTYTLTAYDARSSGGFALASQVLGKLQVLAGVSSGRCWAASSTAPEVHLRRLHSTIAGIFEGPRNLSGICVEPWFLDQPAHQGLADGVAVGAMLGAGIDAWLRS